MAKVTWRGGAGGSWTGGAALQAADSALTADTDFFRSPGTDYGTLTLNGATLTVGDLVVEGAYRLALTNDAVWQTGTLKIGPVISHLPDPPGFLPGGGALTVDGGTLESTFLALGAPTAVELTGSGALAAVNGAHIVSAGMNLDFSRVTIDAASSIVLGAGPATAGALTVGTGGGLEVTSGEIAGNLIIDGAVGINGYFARGLIHAELSVSGDITVGSAILTSLFGGLTAGGTMTVQAGGTFSAWGNAQVDGLLTLAAGRNGAPGGAMSTFDGIVRTGGIALQAGSSLDIRDSSFLRLTAGALSVGAGATLTVDSYQGSSTIDGDVVDAGALRLLPSPSSRIGAPISSSLAITGDLILQDATLDIPAAAALDVRGRLSGGDVTVAAGGSLSIGTLDHDLILSGTASVGAALEAPTITLRGPDAMLTLGGAGALGLTLAGAITGDAIDFPGLSASGAGVASAVLADGTLVVTSASGQSASLALVDGGAGHTFEATPDGHGGTLVQVQPSGATAPLLATTLFDGTPGTDYGTYLLAAGTVTDGALVVSGNHIVQLAPGALWQTGGMAIGAARPDLANPPAFLAGNGELTVTGGGAMRIGGTLALGSDPSSLPIPAGTGRFSVAGGSTVNAAAAELHGATLTVDGSSALVVGAGSGAAGALTVAAGATLLVSDGAIDGNLIDAGLIGVLPLPDSLTQPSRLAIGGDLTLTSGLAINDATDFSIGGSLHIRNGGSLGWAVNSVGFGSTLVATGYAVAGGVTLGVAGGGLATAGTLDLGFGFVNVPGALALYSGSYLRTAAPDGSGGSSGTITAGTITADRATIDCDLSVDTLMLSPTAAAQPGLTVTGMMQFKHLTIGAGERLQVRGTLTNGEPFWDHTRDVTVEAGGSLTARTLDCSMTLDGAANVGDVTYGQTIWFGAGNASLTLGRANPPNLTLVGLQPGDRIDFTTVSSIPNGQFGTGAASMSGGSLLLTGAGGTTASVLLGDSPALQFTVAPDGAGGSLVTAIACFAAGTRILAEHGERAVESLRAGDLVRTAGGRLAPVRWVGSTRIDLTRHPAPHRAAPIRVAAGAIAPGIPHRDLLLSRDHALHLDGALIPVWQLANGASIAREDGRASVTYHHVELDRHDILLAEGCPAESYLDTGNRGLFAEAGGIRPLHPAFEAPDPAALRIWAERAAAPLRLGAAAEPARQALRERAAALGWSPSDDPAPLAALDGAAVPLHAAAPGIWRAHLSRPARTLRLRSRSFVPAETQAGSGDARRLGLAVRAVLLGGWPLPPEAFGDGWHAPDAADAGWRWSDGDAGLILPRDMRPALLEVRTAPAAARYWATTRTDRPARPSAATPAALRSAG